MNRQAALNPQETMNPQGTLEALQPSSDFFVGIDSDGCALDVMTIKHEECFAPAAIKVFSLQNISHLVRETWLFDNLYSVNRGRNRWVTLDLLFDHLKQRPEVLERGTTLPQGTDLKAFLASGETKSDAGLAAYRKQYDSEELELCARWSQTVTELTEWMVSGCGPFPGVRESLEKLAGQADCMTVSAARSSNLETEWNEHGLAPYMRVLAGQEYGSKAEQLHAAARGKYPAGQVLLLGDAPGDLEAALQEEALFYPIIPGQEAASWQRFHTEAIDRFLAGTYAGAYQEQLIAQFQAVLPSGVPWKTL